MTEMKRQMVYFAADHAGFALKETLLAYVRDELGYNALDCGAFEMNEADDYPTFIRSAVRKVLEAPAGACAIILGGSGEGEAIAANRFTGIRAAVYYGGNPDILSLSREHNDANVLSLGARFLDEADAKDAVRLWLSTPFSNDERHVRRVAMLEE